MNTLSNRDPKRQGTTLVETAVVLGIFLIFLFGILEYCRFIYYRQIITNAAREGARYAVVNTYSSTVEADTISYVNKKVFGVDKSVSNYSVEVYAGDANLNKVGKIGDAQFGEYIIVKVSCNYTPFLPDYLFMGNSIPMKSVSLMYSEAN